jgi:peptidoglycan/xylan/chitin deacetylase (PgdA/CDA1 family)
VTFDDAFRSVHKLAFPLMERLGVTGTVFVPTAFADSGRPISITGMERWVATPHEDELQPMTWDELRELRNAGWEIGSHTVSHPHLTQLDDEGVVAELRESRARCEEALGPCESLAYPYGDHDDRVVEAARDAGYTTGCTVPDQLNERDPLRWPRIGIYRVDTTLTFNAKVSPSLRHLRRSSVWPPVARAIRQARGRAR